jgi:hypothetical protein
VDLKVCADDDEAVRFVATLAADWPAIAEITGQYPEDLLALHGGW